MPLTSTKEGSEVRGLELHAQNLGWPDDSIGRWGRSAAICDEIGHTAIFAGASPPDTAGWSDQFLRIRVARDALGEPAVTGGVWSENCPILLRTFWR